MTSCDGMPAQSEFWAPIRAVSSVHQPPDSPWRGGAGKIRDAERGQCVQDGVGDSGKGSDRAGFAAAFDAERVGRAAGAVEADMKGRQVVGCGIA